MISAQHPGDSLVETSPSPYYPPLEVLATYYEALWSDDFVIHPMDQEVAVPLKEHWTDMMKRVRTPTRAFVVFVPGADRPLDLDRSV